MRHEVRKKRFDRTSSHRIAMFRNMVTSLIKQERITTTLPKAKALRSLAERMVTLAKVGTLHARRQAARIVREPAALTKLFAELGPRFKSRPGGYTRVLRLGFRRGDGAPMAFIEYLGFDTKKKDEKKAPAPAPKKAKKKAPKKEAKADKAAAKKDAKKEKAEKKEKAPKKEKKAKKD